MEKQWKYIEGSNECYVSNFGEVKQIVGDIEKMLHQFVDNKGYMRVTVRRCDENGNTIPGKSVRVHRLVAEAFLEPIEGKEQVNHINGDKTCNLVDNLEWVTPRENAIHAVQTGLKKVSTDKSPIGVVDLVGHKATTFESVNEASRCLGILKDDIFACLGGRAIQARGCTFGYLDESLKTDRITAPKKVNKAKQQLIKAKQSDYELSNKKTLGVTKRKFSKEGYYVGD